MSTSELMKIKRNESIYGYLRLVRFVLVAIVVVVVVFAAKSQEQYDSNGVLKTQYITVSIN